MTSLELETNDATDNYSFPLTGNVLHFSVTAKSDVNLHLMTSKQSAEPLFEILIGSDENQYTTVMGYTDGNKVRLSQIKTENILNENERTYFWFKNQNGYYSLGIVGKTEACASFTCPIPISEPHIGLSSAGNAIWIIDLQDDNLVSTCKLPPCNPRWEPVDEPTRMPDGAFCGGFENGNPVEIGRGVINGATTPGKILNNRLSVEYDNSENFLDTFEVLCDCDGKFVAMKHGDPLPEHTYIAGEEHGYPIYIARIYREQNLLIGKYYPHYNKAYFSDKGLALTTEEFEIFVCNAPTDQINLNGGQYEDDFIVNPNMNEIFQYNIEFQ